jgi:prepilin-type N-terminal cleavage/methylation domain-containing protein
MRERHSARVGVCFHSLRFPFPIVPVGQCVRRAAIDELMVEACHFPAAQYGRILSMFSKAKRGFTLMELLVVISILALLAAVAVPKIADIYERSRSSTQAYSLSDVNRQLEIFYGINKKYPDGWDTLMESGGVYSKLPATVTQYTTTATLTPDQITSLNAAGIGHAFLHDAASTDYSNSGVDRRHFGTGTGHDGTANINELVAIDKSAGSKGLSLLVNDFGLNPNKSATDTSLTRINANTYVVFGLGNKSTIVQNQIQEAPILDHATSSTQYSRALVVYEVPNTGTTRAKLVGVLAPDGRSKSLSIKQYNGGETAH